MLSLQSAHFWSPRLATKSCSALGSLCTRHACCEATLGTRDAYTTNPNLLELAIAYSNRFCSGFQKGDNALPEMTKMPRHRQELAILLRMSVPHVHVCKQNGH